MVGGHAHPALARIRRIGPTGIFLVTLALVLVALLVLDFVGALILMIMAVAMAVLLAATWSRHDARSRWLRIAVLTLLMVLALVRLNT